jgi:hypothetical protein
MKNHCCDIMENYAMSDNCLVEYIPETRSYSFYLTNHPNGTRQKMYYCFWCGSELPKDLNEEWSTILKEDYGITDAGFTWNKKDIPLEFKTDKWWKKRRLTYKNPCRDQSETGVFIPMSEFTQE